MKRKHGIRAQEAADDDEDSVTSNSSLASDHSADESLNETAAEKRLRIAQEYLAQLKQQQDQKTLDYDALELDQDLISKRLRQDAQEQRDGGSWRRIAAELNWSQAKRINLYSGKHSQNVVGAKMQFPYCWTLNRDGFIQKWFLDEEPRKVCFFDKKRCAKLCDTLDIKPAELQYGDSLAIAVSCNAKWLAVGTRKGRIAIFDAETLALKTLFKQHRDAVYGLVFRKNTQELYSCSADRTIKLWVVDQAGFVQTLYGHQDVITDIDALQFEHCVTVGARDRTARFWKIPGQTQLILHVSKKEGDSYSGSAGCVDCVSQIDSQTFLTGSDNGGIDLWSIKRKRPLCSRRATHGIHGSELLAQSTASPRWITSIACCRLTDVFATGSWDGRIRLWKLSNDLGRFEAIKTPSKLFQVRGCVNSLQLTLQDDYLLLLAAVGRETRLGRWKQFPKAPNYTVFIKIPVKPLE